MLPVTKAQTASGGFQAWQVSTGMRLTPASMQAGRGTEAGTEAFRNEIVSMQFAVRSARALKPFTASCEASSTAGAEQLPCSWVRFAIPVTCRWSSAENRWPTR